MSELKEELKGSTAGGRTPPYIAFNTLLTFLEEIKTNGLPPQIDSSVLKRFSGSVRTQLLSALKYLGLMSDDKKPTPALAYLAEAHGNEPALKERMKDVITKAYSFLSAIDLKTATPTMFADEFRKHSAGQDAVLQKSRSFYLQAAKFSGIELGQRLTSGSTGAPRTGGPKAAPRRRTTTPKKKIEEAPAGNQHHHIGNGDGRRQAGRGMMDKLLEKFPKLDPAWPEDIKGKWFDNFSKLMASVEEKE